MNQRQALTARLDRIENRIRQSHGGSDTRIVIIGVDTDGTINPDITILAGGKAGRKITPDDSRYPRDQIDGWARQTKDEVGRLKRIRDEVEQKLAFIDNPSTQQRHRGQP